MKNDITLWDFVLIARRHWKLIVLGFVCTLGLAVVATAMMSPKYRSESMLFVRLGRENLSTDAIGTLSEKAGVNMVDTRENEINSMTNVIKSRELAEKVVDQVTPELINSDDESLRDRIVSGLGGWLFPYYALSKRDQAVYTLQNKIRIKALEKSSVIRISYDAPDPLVAQKIVQAMVNAYLVHHSQIHRTSGSLTFLENELKSSREQLLGKEDQLRQLKSRTGLIAPADQRSALVGRISKLKSDLMEAQASRDAIASELDTLGKTLNDMPDTEISATTTGAGNPAVDAMRAKVFDLQTQLNELSSRYSDEHIKVKQLRQALAGAQEILVREEANRQQTTKGRSRAFDETNLLVVRKDAELKALTTKIVSLAGLVAAEEKRLDELNSVELQIDQLNREIGILNSNFQKYSTDVERARIDADLENKSLTNVSVVQAATLNRMPVFPIVSLNLAMGGIMGVFLGGLLGLLAEMRNNRLRAPPVALAATNGATHSRLDSLAEVRESHLEQPIRNPR